MNDQALQMQIKTLQQQVKELQALTKFIKVSGAEVTLKAPVKMVIEATNLTINAGAILDLKGSIIKLNNGSKPAARLGSKTAGNQATQTIVDGSPTVFMP